jgi:type II secretory pathway pseudopilin PulG
MSARQVRPSEEGLTLIELLVVMGILVALATLLIAHLGPYSRTASRQEATRALVKRVDMAVQSYKTELGAYPPDFVHLLTRQTKTVVTGDASDPRSTVTLSLGPFLVLPKERISPDGKDILDDWDTPLHYDPTRSLGWVWSDNVTDR